MPAWLIPAVTAGLGFLGNLFGGKKKDEDTSGVPSWGDFGRGAGQSGIEGLLTYLLSTGDRNKKRQLEDILMAMVKEKQAAGTRQDRLMQDYQKQTMPLTPQMVSLLQARLNAPRPTIPNLDIQPFGKGYNGPLTARTGGMRVY